MARFNAYRPERETYRHLKKLSERNPVDIDGISSYDPERYARMASEDPVRTNVAQHKVLLRKVVGRASGTITATAAEKKALSEFIIRAHGNPPLFNVFMPMTEKYSVPSSELEKFISKVGGKERAYHLLRQFSDSIAMIGLPLSNRNRMESPNKQALHLMDHAMANILSIAVKAWQQIKGKV
ncbi:MAG: hypothetical protein ABIG96_01555 [Candidatus Micrarchaeota archaeon]